MIRSISIRRFVVLAALAIATAAAPFAVIDSEAFAARKKGHNVWDDRTGKWVKKKVVYRRRTVPAKFRKRKVRLYTQEKPGTIIVDTSTKYLYLVTGKRSAIRYGIGVGRQGFTWAGTVKVARKAKWPSWTPPKEMVEREWRENKRRVGFMKGGPKNPMGARALYLHERGGDTGYRIHGTNEPWSIGLAMSSGCIRLLNKDVTDLYNRAKKGAKVIVIGPDGKNRSKIYRTRGTLFGALSRSG